MSLTTLQALVARHVTQPKGTAASLADQVVGRAPGAEARLAVYRDLVLEAHLDALLQIFSVTAAVLGEAYWRQLLRDLWGRPGSHTADLSQYGQFVPDALAEAIRTQSALADFDYLKELATLEWEVHQAIGKTGPERFDWEAFAQLSEAEQSRARLLPSPALSKVRFEFPVDEIWRRHQGEPAIAAAESPILCCLHPNGLFSIGVTRWPATDEAWLDRLIGGTSLVALGALASPEGVAKLHSIIEQGWITGFERAD